VSCIIWSDLYVVLVSIPSNVALNCYNYIFTTGWWCFLRCLYQKKMKIRVCSYFLFHTNIINQNLYIYICIKKSLYDDKSLYKICFLCPYHIYCTLWWLWNPLTAFSVAVFAFPLRFFSAKRDVLINLPPLIFGDSHMHEPHTSLYLHTLSRCYRMTWVTTVSLIRVMSNRCNQWN